MSIALSSEQLAINGGIKTRTRSFPTGARFGINELDYLKQALDQNTLFYFKGQVTRKFNEKFNKFIGAKYAVACSSGTAALHSALGALKIGVGDEVITTSITDMGTVIGIIYQNAVPIFCDNLSDTYGMDPVDLERKITNKTRAIIVVHLAGNPCDMDAIMQIAARHKIAVIEDCAQAWGGYYKDQHVGTFGAIGCFSTNDFKHISTGDGGVACTNDETLYKRLHLFADKNYDRFIGTSSRDPKELSPNYRWTELQAAVGLAQLEKVSEIVTQRRYLGSMLTDLIKDCPGVLVPKVREECKSSYWFYMFRIDEHRVGQTRDYFAKCLQEEGIPVAAGYIQHPIYHYPVFQNEAFFPNGWPAKMLGLTTVDYRKVNSPIAEQILKSAVLLHINEFFTEEDIYDIAKAIQKVSYALNNQAVIQ